MDLDVVHENVQNPHKWVKLYDSMFDGFNGEGCCVSMDSAYTSNIMVQIRRQEWMMNMVGTIADNCTRSNVKEDTKGMKKETYDSIIYQHNGEDLVLVVRELSNFHSPEAFQDDSSGIGGLMAYVSKPRLQFHVQSRTRTIWRTFT